jgi:methylated-DNA-[protein]-cysteine S-methyltransferase
MFMKFSDRVYDACRMIPKGRVSTYGSIAKALGKSKASRAVGQALRHNPYAPEVPCHRVIASDGRLHGFDGKFNNAEKAKLLRSEGIEIRDNKVDLRKFGFRF